MVLCAHFWTGRGPAREGGGNGPPSAPLLMARSYSAEGALAAAARSESAEADGCPRGGGAPCSAAMDPRVLLVEVVYGEEEGRIGSGKGYLGVFFVCFGGRGWEGVDMGANCCWGEALGWSMETGFLHVRPIAAIRNLPSSGRPSVSRDEPVLYLTFFYSLALVRFTDTYEMPSYIPPRVQHRDIPASYQALQPVLRLPRARYFLTTDIKRNMGRSSTSPQPCSSTSSGVGYHS